VAEERIFNFKSLVTLTLTLDQVTCTPSHSIDLCQHKNFTQTGRMFVDGYRPYMVYYDHKKHLLS